MGRLSSSNVTIRRDKLGGIRIYVDTNGINRTESHTWQRIISGSITCSIQLWPPPDEIRRKAAACKIEHKLSLILSLQREWSRIHTLRRLRACHPLLMQNPKLFLIVSLVSLAISQLPPHELHDSPMSRQVKSPILKTNGRDFNAVYAQHGRVF